MIPNELRYLKTHEWARREGDVVTVGLTDFAAEQLGDIVYVELPKVGTQVKKEQAFGAIESVKAASELYGPVSGQATEVNEAISKDLEIFKQDAYGKAWLIRIKMADEREFDSLMEAGEYEKHIKSIKSEV